MIISVWGGNGFGKTSIAMEMAVTIGGHGKTVCIISAEDYCEMSIRYGRYFTPENSITEAVREPQKIRSCRFEVDKNTFYLGPSLLIPP